MSTAAAAPKGGESWAHWGALSCRSSGAQGRVGGMVRVSGKSAQLELNEHITALRALEPRASVCVSWRTEIKGTSARKRPLFNLALQGFHGSQHGKTTCPRGWAQEMDQWWWISVRAARVTVRLSRHPVHDECDERATQRQIRLLLCSALPTSHGAAAQETFLSITCTFIFSTSYSQSYVLACLCVLTVILSLTRMFFISTQMQLINLKMH